jgi:hypothetical protein
MYVPTIQPGPGPTYETSYVYPALHRGLVVGGARGLELARVGIGGGLAVHVEVCSAPSSTATHTYKLPARAMAELSEPRRETPRRVHVPCRLTLTCMHGPIRAAPPPRPRVVIDRCRSSPACPASYRRRTSARPHGEPFAVSGAQGQDRPPRSAAVQQCRCCAASRRKRTRARVTRRVVAVPTSQLKRTTYVRGSSTIGTVPMSKEQ